MRLVQEADLPMEPDVVDALDSCVQCRGCEPACPSGVPFGGMIARATDHLPAGQLGVRARVARAGMGLLSSRAAVAAGVGAVRLANSLGIGAGRLPQLRKQEPLRLPPEPAQGAETVWLTTGCVMDAAMTDVHQATVDVLAAAGASIRRPDAHEGCCGALAAHAGAEATAHRQTARFAQAFPGAEVIISNSAGCGAHLQSCGDPNLSARVVDVHTWLAERLHRLPIPRQPLGEVIVQEPCHLRNVQHGGAAFRKVLGQFFTVIETDDEGLCCGAGGSYSALRPTDAVAIRDRKVAALRRAGTVVVASANPGCELHLAAAGVDVQHSMVLVADALRRLSSGS